MLFIWSNLHMRTIPRPNYYIITHESHTLHLSPFNIRGPYSVSNVPYSLFGGWRVRVG